MHPMDLESSSIFKDFSDEINGDINESNLDILQ